MKNLLFCRIKSAHNDKGGQALVFVVLTLFTLVCFLAFTINVGHRITAKVQMQNAADAAAMSGGIWIARGLNLESILNVSLTELLALIIFLEAVKKGNEMLPAVAIATGIIYHACCAFWFTAPLCCPLATRFDSSIAPEIPSFIQTMNDRIDNIIPRLWDTMDMIVTAEDAVERTAIMAPLKASVIACQNGAETIGVDVFFPLSTSLPVQKGEFIDDLCPPTAENASQSEYPAYKNFKCWDGGALSMEMDVPLLGPTKVKHAFALAWVLFPPFPDTAPLIPPMLALYELYLVDAAYDAMCGGGGDFQITNTTTNCSVCRANNGTNIDWGGGGIRVTRNDPHPDYEIDDTGGPPLYQRPSTPLRSAPGYPGYTFDDGPTGCRHWVIDEREDTSRPRRNPDNTIMRNSAGNIIYETYLYKTEWKLQSCRYTSSDSVQLSQASSRSDKPKPMMLDPDWVDKSEYVALVRKQVDDRLSWTGKTFETQTSRDTFGQVGTNRSFGIAQVKVYNATKADLFNQDWRVRLVPFNPNNIDSQILQNTVANTIGTGAQEMIVH